jgi:hypothetical protein
MPRMKKKLPINNSEQKKQNESVMFFLFGADLLQLLLTA